jgi:carboxypeptidase C (cathepsin A)
LEIALKHAALLATMIALLVMPSHTSAAMAAPAQSASPAAEHAAEPAPSAGDAVTHWTDTVDGRVIPYTATAGTIALKDDKGDVTANMFYVAYTEDGVADLSHRPITFLYNGGPGSSTVWLRMGSFGPKRVVVNDAQPMPGAPYHLVDNEYSLIDKSDLVFIDAVGTGFSRIVKGDPKDFYGVDPDIRAFGQFVERYITQNGRWNSPKFLFGESYGTPRSCGLVNYLQNQSVQISGVVLLSSVINFDEFAGGDGNDMQFIGYLPTEAAIAWYHHKAQDGNADLATAVSRAKQFAMGEYADALLKGAWLSSTERDEVVRTMHQMLGVSEQFIRDSDLRIQPGDFEKQLLHDQTRITGRLDARFVGIDTSPTGENPDYDPASEYIQGAYVATFNDYVRNDLKYHTDLDYYPTNYGVVGRAWQFDHTVDGNQFPIADMMPDLRDAMSHNPRLKIFSANGYFDMATPFFATDYLLAHLGIDPSLRKNISYGYYESGHMVYVHVPALAQFKADLARFYDEATQQ